MKPCPQTAPIPLELRFLPYTEIAIHMAFHILYNTRCCGHSGKVVPRRQWHRPLHCPPSLVNRSRRARERYHPPRLSPTLPVGEGPEAA